MLLPAVKRPSQRLFHSSVLILQQQQQQQCRTTLSEAEKNTYLKPLLEKGWAIRTDGKGLEKIFPLQYRQGALFVQKIATAAEKYNHHPLLTLSYSRVKVVWTSHSAKGITSNDTMLARLCDRIRSDMESPEQEKKKSN